MRSLKNPKFWVAAAGGLAICLLVIEPLLEWAIMPLIDWALSGLDPGTITLPGNPIIYLVLGLICMLLGAWIIRRIY